MFGARRKLNQYRLVNPKLQKDDEMKIRKILIGSVAVLALSGCAQTSERIQSMNWGEMAATLGGAAVGGYVGAQLGGGLAQTAFTAMGVLAGGGAGYVGAKMLSPMDQAFYDTTAQKAFASASPGQLHRWSNPETGNSGMIRTVASYQQPDGSSCQQYRSSVVFDSGVASASGAACQQPDGQWLAYNDTFR
jgi:surface antigen